MNFKFGISLFSAAAISAFANQIPWSIDALDTDAAGLSSDLANPKWQYVFLTEDGSGNLVNGGSNDIYVSANDNGTVEAAGEWSDTIDNSSKEYVVAFWDGDTNSKFAVVKDGDGKYVTVTPSQWDDNVPGAPNVDGRDFLTTVVENVNSGAYTAAAVPEPATAALALAGVALLVRRRK